MQTVHISHPVTLFPQPTTMTCWSAAATMLFGDRSVSAGRARTGTGGGLRIDQKNVRLFAQSHGLTFHAPQCWTVDGLVDLLRDGPLWVAGLVPTGHAYVIGGVQSDGTPERTLFTIYDPWPPGIGLVRRLRYSDMQRKHPRGMMYVLHR